MTSRASRVLATFFGLGFFPIAPGTLASVVTALLWAFVLRDLPWPLYAGSLVALILAGVWAAASYASEIGQPDPGRIVIDEVCGQLVALAFMPRGFTALMAPFVFFRVFDIIKPWPIRKLEGLPGGWGIMADDLAAGLAAAVLARLVLPWLPE